MRVAPLDRARSVWRARRPLSTRCGAGPEGLPGCPPDCVRIGAETNLGGRDSECACGGFALVLPLLDAARGSSSGSEALWDRKLVGRVTATQRCYRDCVDDLDVPAGPDGSEAFCYEEFTLERWVRAEGDFFMRVDFNMSTGGASSHMGVSFFPKEPLGQALDSPCELPLVFWGGFFALYALALLQTWLAGRAILINRDTFARWSDSENSSYSSEDKSDGQAEEPSASGELALELPSLTGTSAGTQEQQEDDADSGLSTPFRSMDFFSARFLSPGSPTQYMRPGPLR